MLRHVTNVPDGPPILATSSTAGSIGIWDLSKGGRLIHVQKRAHEQAIGGLEWVQGQPLLISSSGDNSVKVCAVYSNGESLLTVSNGSLTHQQVYLVCSSSVEAIMLHHSISDITVITGNIFLQPVETEHFG